MPCFRVFRENKKLTKIQKKQCIEFMLDKSFPFLYCIFSVIFSSITACATISIEIYRIYLKDEKYYLGSG